MAQESLPDFLNTKISSKNNFYFYKIEKILYNYSNRYSNSASRNIIYEMGKKALQI